MKRVAFRPGSPVCPPTSVSQGAEGGEVGGDREVTRMFGFLLHLYLYLINAIMLMILS